MLKVWLAATPEEADAEPTTPAQPRDLNDFSGLADYWCTVDGGTALPLRTRFPMISRRQQEGATVSGVLETSNATSTSAGTVTDGVLSFTSKTEGSFPGTFGGTSSRAANGRERMSFEGRNCNGTLKVSCVSGMAPQRRERAGGA